MTFLLIFVELPTMHGNWFDYVFHAISASTTTGFQFLDLSTLSNGGKTILMILMLVGGTAFSTAGGIKMARFLILSSKITGKSNDLSDSLIQTSFSSLSEQFGKKYQVNNAKSRLKDSKRYQLLYDKAFKEALIVLFLFVTFSFLTAIIISNSGDFDFMDSLFESISTVTNSGLSVGITSINLDIVSKIFLSINMIFGRFEIIAILYIFVSRLRR